MEWWSHWLGLLLLSCLECSGDEPPVALTAQGRVFGRRLATWTGRPFIAFTALRYARPPVGQLRFKPPEPADIWDGVEDATKDPPACPQPASRLHTIPSSEDCLFLNVYTKKLEAKFPVIVYFHQGDFIFGTSRSDVLGPQYLLDRDIVLVAPQSRLGPLGYLSSGDEHAPGNFGLKDQAAALRWVRENISNFGGNPNSVTIAGYGTGSTSVYLHMMSPLSKGLFHKAIAMSGPVLGQSVVREKGELGVTALAQANNCTVDQSTEQLVECLRDIPVDQLVETSLQVSIYDDGSSSFGPVVEELNVENSGATFISRTPSDLIKRGKFTQVPVVIGNTKDEYIALPELIQYSNVEYERLSNFKNQTTALKELYSIYLGNDTLKSMAYGTTKFLSDRILIYPQQQSAKLLAYFSDKPVYFYMTSYSGRHSFLKNRTNKNDPEVGHVDDLLYLFYIPEVAPLIKPTDPEAHAVNTFTSIWSNFASKGNPTPVTAAEGVSWLPMDVKDLQYLDIGENVTMKPGLPHEDRMRVLLRYDSIISNIT